MITTSIPFSKRYLKKHEVDDALNEYFTSRGYATVIHELPPHEASKYAEEEYDWLKLMDERGCCCCPSRLVLPTFGIVGSFELA